jgi:hypothetical protein
MVKSADFPGHTLAHRNQIALTSQATLVKKASMSECSIHPSAWEQCLSRASTALPEIALTIFGFLQRTSIEQKSSRKLKDLGGCDVLGQNAAVLDCTHTPLLEFDEPSIVGHAKSKRRINDMVNMGVEPRTLALLAPRSKPTELIDRHYHVIDGGGRVFAIMYLAAQHP